MLEIGQEWILYTTPFRLKEVSAAPTGGEIIPNVVSFYAKDNGSGVSTLCYKTDAGTEICLPTVGPIVTGSGTANRLAKWTGTSTIGDFVPTAGSVIFAGTNGIGQEDNANFFWDDTNNRLGLGINSSLLAKLHIKDENNAGFQLDEYNSVDGVVLRLKAALNTIASPIAITTDSVIFGIRGFGWTSSAAFGIASVALNARAAENFTSTAQGTYLQLSTTAIGTATLSERFRVGPSGQLGIGGATYGSNGDIFSSGGAGAAPTWVTRATLNAALDHGTLAGLGDDDHTQYLLVAGTRALSANWDAGSFEVRAQTFQSDVVTGTAPLIIASTTKVTNLNVDLLDDQSGAYYLDSANFTGINWTDLTDGGTTTLHSHSGGGGGMSQAEILARIGLRA